jgi:hypothetical protein
VSEPADTSRVDAGAAPGHDPNYILSQEEFHGTIDDLKIGLEARWRGTQGAIGHEFRKAEQAFGWLVWSFAIWLAILGHYALKGDLRDP